MSLLYQTWTISNITILSYYLIGWENKPRFQQCKQNVNMECKTFEHNTHPSKRLTLYNN